MRQGDGNAFRDPGWLERTGRRVGRLMPASATRLVRRGYERLLSATAGDSLISTLPGGERIHVLPQHRQMTWNREEYEALRVHTQPGTVAIDVGANVGAYALLFGFWVGPVGKVFAFEPAPDALAGLRGHVAINGLEDRVFPQQMAVSHCEGSVAFTASGHDGGNRIVAGGGGAETVSVRCTTLDAFCRTRQVVPSTIKIDAEGAELDVLRGAREIIRAAGPALGLFVEMHPRLWPAFGVTPSDMTRELHRQGLAPERLDGGADVWSLEGVVVRLRPCAS
jgi:FkbM family methyltransferase